jgi:predicted nucleic acid-binding protein
MRYLLDTNICIYLSKRNHPGLLAKLAQIPVNYGRIKENLRAKGQIIGENDLWIASHALAEDYILVTNNMREFKRIKGLKIENWAA